VEDIAPDALTVVLQAAEAHAEYGGVDSEGESRIKAAVAALSTTPAPRCEDGNFGERMYDTEVARSRPAAPLGGEPEKAAHWSVRLRAADRLAREVKRLVDTGKLDARSPAGDALLDYGGVRNGEWAPLSDFGASGGAPETQEPTHCKHCAELAKVIEHCPQHMQGEAPETAPLTVDSGTYGELPASVRAMIVGHEWDNMTVQEQRAWAIAALAARPAVAPGGETAAAVRAFAMHLVEFGTTIQREKLPGIANAYIAKLAASRETTDG
jgi:hypothetical protein